jgi:Na+-translocating ferredoxin:NAD+ oxidoreductase RnfG subunit
MYMIKMYVAALLVIFSATAGAAESDRELFPKAASERDISNGHGPPIETLTQLLHNEEIIGYQCLLNSRSKSGAYQVLLSLDAHGRVICVRVLKHKGPKSHLVKNSSTLRKYIGRHISEFTEKGQKYDAISGATSTAISLFNTIRDAARQFQKFFPEPGVT